MTAQEKRFVSGEYYGFSITTGAGKFTATASAIIYNCPKCGHAHKWDNGQPVNAISDKMTVCPDCGIYYFFYDRINLDLSAELADMMGRSVDYCDALAILRAIAYDWAERIGAVREHKSK